MFFVDDDQAHRGQRGKHRGPGADDHIDLPSPDPIPLVVSGAVGQAAVLHRDACTEDLSEAGRDRRGQRDLRHKNQRLTLRRQRRPRQLSVDLRLAAAGDTVQQSHGESPGPGRLHQRIDRRLLVGCQHPVGPALRLRGHGGLGRPRVPLDDLLTDGQTTLFDEPSHRLARDPAPRQLRNRHSRRGPAQHLERLALSCAQRGPALDEFQPVRRDPCHADRLERAGGPLERLRQRNQPVASHRSQKRM